MAFTDCYQDATRANAYAQPKFANTYYLAYRVERTGSKTITEALPPLPTTQDRLLRPHWFAARFAKRKGFIATGNLACD